MRMSSSISRLIKCHHNLVNRCKKNTIYVQEWRQGGFCKNLFRLSPWRGLFCWSVQTTYYKRKAKLTPKDAILCIEILNNFLPLSSFVRLSCLYDKTVMLLSASKSTFGPLVWKILVLILHFLYAIMNKKKARRNSCDVKSLESCLGNMNHHYNRLFKC